MLSRVLNDLYSKFRLYFYMQTAKNIENREAALTTSETFCMEVINSLGNPTVSEFASVSGISSPNAAAKVGSLIRKGYVEKVQSENDKRMFYLHPTEKFNNYYRISIDYLEKVQRRCEKRFSKEEMDNLGDLLRIIDDELTTEVDVNRLKAESGEKDTGEKDTD